MAAVLEKLQEFQREITCSICRSYFSEPVTVWCGHSFCRACLSQSWTLGATAFSCPECRQVSPVRKFPGVNGLLAQLTDMGKELCFLHLQSAEGQSHCGRHRKVFKLFCEDDHAPLCVGCSQSPEHGAHKLSPVEEAAQKSRKKLQHIRSDLQKRFDEAEELLAQEERLVDDWNWVIAGAYTKLHQFLREEESQCLERIVEEERASQDSLSQHRQALQDLMLVLQEAGHQPNMDLLQEVKQLLGRSESVLSQRAKVVSPELREYPIPGMIKMLRRFRVDITLNPTSDNPFVTVSEDLKSVKAAEGWQVETKHDSDDFVYHYVFAEQAFSSGRQYWEVDVTQLPQWTLGIHTPFLRKRRGRNVDSSPPVFLLCCVKKEEDYYLQTYPGSLNHRIKVRVPRVGIYLEYTPGTLAFYNVLQRSLIYRFYPIPFTDPITPIFCPGPPLPGSKAGPMTGLLELPDEDDASAAAPDNYEHEDTA
ncbi:tripartite motif-containing protein 43-like [Trichosurus vulpecula]|uniref:tripartite motif-containing protein 43-like n=1 Tax=Trichosurus vulpecula TaxID=9337 RepID=UPI00186B482C|nr:tripartite motif-containing protein 43-like [Trichosurus vulpecula]